MASYRLAELTPDNIGEALRLEVGPGQDTFVASVADSLAHAYVSPSAWPRLVYDGDAVVGFVMANFEPYHEIEELQCGIWRLLVAAHAQGRGVGRFAVEAVATEARRRGQSRITVLWVPGEGGPQDFYERMGFTITGKLFGQVVGAKQI
ncbi:GNAT family N-acetyltransferase [Antribacter gilvus]|uniref:GNAT family N-acetyltransferase n=1 Tax=Antribacter gilvus TaxID=2304675 RepID=UPI000F788EBB|nr:GNAT family N-acetyltransferase [Antribacter gilvus]